MQYLGHMILVAADIATVQSHGQDTLAAALLGSVEYVESAATLHCI